MDAITMLKNDHKKVKGLFRDFAKAKERSQKVALVEEITRELLVHGHLEETFFYPRTRRAVEGIDDVVLEAMEEHHITKWTLAELANLDPADERYDAKVNVLIEMVKHHIDEEEGEYFPKVRDSLGRAELAKMGEEMEQIKEHAPSEPEPFRQAESDQHNVALGGASSRFSFSRRGRAGETKATEPSRGRTRAR